MSRVLIADKLSPRAVDVFQERGIDVDFEPSISVEELLACVGEYEGLAVRSRIRVTDEVIAAGTRLRVIGRAGIGVDNIDIPTATARGIVVMNTPFGNAVTTAEHAIALMMSLARRIPEADRSTQAGRWEKSSLVGTELCGKTLGVIGCGNIGGIVANRAQGLKMRVIAFDPFLSADRAQELGVEPVDLDALLERADFITLHTPLNDQTRGILRADTLARTRRGVRIINCARGGLVVEADLKAAIESGQVAGAAVDVYESEPARENVLFGMPQIVATPHLGASTKEAQETVALQIAAQMADFLNLGAVTHALNTASISPEDAPRLRPYSVLAEQLGGFLGQSTEGLPKSLQIDFVGHVASLSTPPLTAAIVEAVLAPHLEGINRVNAPVLAREHGIEIGSRELERQGDYETLVRLTASTEAGTRVVEGTLFADSGARLVSVDGISIQAVLGRHMLFVQHSDEPGFIGGIGALLGNGGINIATFNLGRAERGGDALCLVEVDQAVPADLVQQVRELPQVRSARGLRF